MNRVYRLLRKSSQGGGGISTSTNNSFHISLNGVLQTPDKDDIIDLKVLSSVYLNGTSFTPDDKGKVDLGNLASRIVVNNGTYYPDADGQIDLGELGGDYVRKVDSLSDYLPEDERAVYNREDDNYYRTEWRQDDVATAYLGEDWRMPTREELEELSNLSFTYDSTTMMFTIVGTNGNRIILPAAGVRRDTEEYNFVGTSLGLWSSTLATEWGDDVVWGYWLDERAGYTQYDWFNTRYDAYAVLPVTETTAIGSIDLGLSVRWANALLSKDKTLNNSNPVFVQWGDTEHKDVASYYDYKFAIVDDYGFTEYTIDDGRDTLAMTAKWKKVECEGGEGGQAQTIEMNVEDLEGLETNSLNNIVVDGQAYIADDIYAKITSTDYRKVIQPAVIKGKNTRTLNLQTGWSVKQLGNFGKKDCFAVLSNVDLMAVAKETDTASLAAANYNAWLKIGVKDANGDVHFGEITDQYNYNMLTANQMQTYVLPYVGGGGGEGGGGSTVVANKEGVYGDDCSLLESITIDGVSYNTHQVKYIMLNSATYTANYDEEELGFKLNVATDATLNGKSVHVDGYGRLNLPSTASVLIVDGRRYEVNAQGVIDVDTDISFFASHAGLNSLGNDTYNHRIEIANTPTPIKEDHGLNTDNQLVMFLEIGKSGVIPSSSHTSIEEGYYIQPVQYTISIVREGDFGIAPLYATNNVPIQLDFDNEVKINFELDFNPCTGQVNGWKFTKIDPDNLVEGFALTGVELQDMSTRPTAGKVLRRYPKLVMKLKDEGKYRIAFSGRTARTKNSSALTAEAHSAQAYYKVYESALSTARRSLTWEEDRQQWSTVLTQYREGLYDMIDPWMVGQTIYLSRDGYHSYDEDGKEYLMLYFKEEYESEYGDVVCARQTEGGYNAYQYDEYDYSASLRVYHEVFIPADHVEYTESWFGVQVLADEPYADCDWSSLTMQTTTGSGEWKSGTLAVYPTAHTVRANGTDYKVDVSTGVIDLGTIEGGGGEGGTGGVNRIIFNGKTFTPDETGAVQMGTTASSKRTYINYIQMPLDLTLEEGMKLKWEIKGGTSWQHPNGAWFGPTFMLGVDNRRSWVGTWIDGFCGATLELQLHHDEGCNMCTELIFVYNNGSGLYTIYTTVSPDCEYTFNFSDSKKMTVTTPNELYADYGDYVTCSVVSDAEYQQAASQSNAYRYNVAGPHQQYSTHGWAFPTVFFPVGYVETMTNS